MQRQNKTIDWDEIQRAELRTWYYTSKIMGQIIPGNFPYFTFNELWKQINEDPQYKANED